ncbi:MULTISPECIES: nucleoside triphosphate pyrophosphohydrolase [unclassified Microcoleus]|uniref:nucleoside triphosphate pyrophosphohydrolase n=1 Tax=unclassified Microcoleus TaxID=2642155 RepID=UPI001D5C66A8|nr:MULTISPECIES: nucleoside triphosphate pyrophosphohydrolase [unclassified Microcoleus]MCC3466640.1 nucleoside triphosphate pyrophosphohydrolase [Microcoleus sp. PH2017_06_SFM_O_A]TAE44557.1 MAG: nucleoside triphosphate pyrophosphohydrolase [Oscillatoriales cyanobacterium]MCC3415365.1 nucleoside triphosphate pyrophosphohydrolase [Microcoleus sp. PH2017_02_FOX_O_A]MCC3428237.1 nucleoside triphosphate pyrophosphohydrolase [Microcoleus sp. PH2017_01_SCD_O_A]MCC3436858.1 nucleoside triphosphate p
MSNSHSRSLVALENLIEVVASLRSPDGGCPWDLAQTPETLIPHIIEEAYETADAIRKGDKSAIVEELGDLLLQVILQAQIASESEQFTFAEVAAGITEKLIRRHPHVFGDAEINSVDEVNENWEKIKAAEKGITAEKPPTLASKMSRYASTLPPITAAAKISQKAAEVSFDWDSVDGVWDKFHEEMAEFEHALKHEDKAAQQSELGDIMFVLIQLARWYDLDASAALQGTNDRFVQRFAKVEAACDRPLSDYPPEELDALWEQAKALLAKQKGPQ